MTTMSGKHLTFTVPSMETEGDDSTQEQLQVKLHQATDDDENQGEHETNTGFIMWPSAVLLSHHLSQNPKILRGDDVEIEGDVCEIGAGCGLVGLTAAALMQGDDACGDDKVVFTDYNPAVVDNLKRNVLLNQFDVDHEVYGLDWFDQEPSDDEAGEAVEREENTWVDTDGKVHGQFRLILGADLIVCSNDADLVATTIDCALMEGGRAVILGASADARFGVSDFPEACHSRGLSVSVDENILENIGDGNENGTAGQHQRMMDDMNLSGHNQRAATFGHDFTMFTIDKPIKETTCTK